MSLGGRKIESRNVTRNQATFDRTVDNIFLWKPEYKQETFLNNTGSELELKGGELLGRVSSTGKIVVLTSGAADGSQFPVGMNKTCVTVADSAEVVINMCVAGDVAQELVIFQGSDTLDTVVNDRQLRDRIAGDTKGIQLVEGREHTKFDN